MSRKNWSSEKLFNRLLNNKTQKTYWENIRELRKRPDNEVFERAMSLGKSGLEKEKIIGIDILAQLGIAKRFKQQQIITFYFSILNAQQTPKVLFSTLSAIGHNNNSLKKKQISQLAKFKNHNYSDVRFSLVCALMGVDDEIAIETLIELTNDRHHQVRDWATFSIGSQIELNTPSIIEALRNRLYDTDNNTRFEAISGLAQRKDKMIKDILMKELEKINNYGSLILESIEQYGDKNFIPLLKSQIKKNKITNNINEKWLINCLETLQNNTNIVN